MAAAPVPVPPRAARPATVRWAGLLLAAGALVLCVLLSVAVGAKPLPLGTVLDLLGRLDDPAGGNDLLIVRDLRIPRTLLGLLTGAALGLAGALIQALTRNPLADPGILGVNAGAAFAVILAVGLLGLTSLRAYVWFAFAGAAAAAVVVYAIGSLGRGGGTPERLTLAGVAFGAVLGGIGSGLTLLDPQTFDALRFWTVGTLAGRPMDVVVEVAPFLGIGIVAALALARPLNAVALGDDLAATLGTNVARTRTVGVVAITLLCGGATAAAGPIGFVGLMVPHVARWIVGPDQRWIMAYSVLLAPVLLLAADVLGRVVLRPGELQVGIVTAFVGAPVLIALIRRRKATGL
ncbi:iron chelate uptake ABC transporter family permease subunit [Pseudonocardia kongjuensis]|uniref:iron chelate uptake ABC transporter family permease subunit n=1 Tax=Pseudonocardia kongjuensis TaxID=102227 RepID=UPI0031D28ABA